jgi:hypothetical protein
MFLASYTDEQKNRIMQMPATVLLSSIIADGGSAIVGMSEFMAGEKFITDTGAKYPGNALILDMVKSVDLPKLEEIVKPVLSIGDMDGVRAECQKKIGAGAAVLANDTEANQFKEFLLALSDKVMNASGNGFFGNRGEKVSAKEAAYMQQLKRQLNPASSPSM